MDDCIMNSLTSQIQALINTQPDFPEQLKKRLVLASSKVANPFKFIASLLTEGVLLDGSNKPEVGLKEMMVQLAIMIACAEGSGAIGGLMKALEASGNSQVISALETWVRDDFPTEAGSSKSLADQPTQEEPEPSTSNVFQQPAPLDELTKVATLNSQSQSSGKGTFSLEFDKDGIIAHLADNTIKLWKWNDGDDGELTIELGVDVKVEPDEVITWFQCDEEIVIVGTSAGMVYLFDAKTLDEEWAIKLCEPIDSLKFVDSSVVIQTRGQLNECGEEHFWWAEISRSNMQFVNYRLLLKQDFGYSSKFLVDPHYTFVYYFGHVKIYDTKTGKCVFNTQKTVPASFLAPAIINTLQLVDLNPSKRFLVAGCKNGVIAMWDTSKLMSRQKPFMTFQGHVEAIVGLCDISGHLISADQSGKLLLWSGYELTNDNMKEPVPRVLAQNFHNVSCLVGCERWFASSSSKNGFINVWTLPDSWLRTG